jgi:hypothetical protein
LFIEKPFRNNNFNFKKILNTIFLIFGILIIFNSYILFKGGKVNRLNIMIDQGISSPLFISDCKFSTSETDFMNNDFFIKNFTECKKKYDKFILILGDSHSVDLYNSISKLSKSDEFIIGLNKGGCRPLDKNIDKCHYNNSLEFIKKFNENIKYIFFTHKGSYFLTNIGTKKDISSSKLRKLPLNFNQINYTINYLKKIKQINSNLIYIGPHIEPNVDLNYKTLKNFLDRSFPDKSNYDLIKVDKKLKEVTELNNITYISKIDILEFKFEEDFIVDGNLNFSDTDHWSKNGEIYFGKKLIFKSILKDILYPSTSN